jgi:predicted alpha/beta-hydrolase family hydrolase
VPSSSREFGNLLLGRPLRDGGPDARMLERLAGVPVPARILVGSADVVAPPEEVRAHVAPHVGVVVLEGLDHFFRARGPGADAAAALTAAVDEALASLLLATR